MSWDVSIFASDTAPVPVADMPKDWRGAILGSLDSVRKSISRHFPDTDWRDPSWGIYSGGRFTFEFNLGSQDPCDGFMIHVRGGSEAAVSHLLALARSTGWYLLDCSQSEWMHHCVDPTAGWAGFQAYRDRVIPRNEN